MTGLPGTSTIEDVRCAVRETYSNPKYVELGEPSYIITDLEAEEMLRTLLSRVGPVDSVTLNGNLNVRRMKALARFQTETDAKEAARRLTGVRITGLRGVLLTVEAITLVRFKIATTIYDVVRTQIELEQTKWAKRIGYKTYRNTDLAQRYTVIRISEKDAEASGKDAEAFREAVDSLEAIVHGVVVMNSLIPLWTPSFHNSNVFAEIQKTLQSIGVHAIRHRSGYIRLYGGVQERGKAIDLLRNRVKHDSSKSKVIQLDQEEFRRGLNGGFQEIISVLGKDVASIDIFSSKITIVGSSRDYETVLRILNSKQPGAGGQPTTGNICPICCSEAENPVRTSCKHTYCFECLENQCSASGSDGKEFSIRCHGASGKCDTALTLSELKENLSSTAFEDLLRASFKSHVRRRPNMFRYCPTKDCEQIYRSDVPDMEQICSTCSCVIFASCHASHPLMTCADYKYQATGGDTLFEQYKQEHDYRNCPNCTIVISKIDGCEHVMCRSCGAHICWVCGAIFETGTACYAHINSGHRPSPGFGIL